MLRIPSKESLFVEFKSDKRDLPHNDLAEAVVCLANAEGGDLWLGIEDDGTVTGLCKKEKNEEQIIGAIASRTVPHLMVHVEIEIVDGKRVACIHVPKTRSEVCTGRGTYLRRCLKPDGTPECVPMFPNDRIIRAASMGLFDVSACPIPEATLKDLDPLERERLRQYIQIYGGDKSLLELDDEELDGVLRLTCIESGGGERIPTVTGLLLIGKESSLRKFLPAHEIAFQVLEREAVQLNEFRRMPLLKAVDWLETTFRPYNPEEEIQVGLFRVPAPKVRMDVFREAVLNALIHRDYHKSGAVHIQLQDDSFIISNPGGFMEGVTLENILTVQPHPRNPALADAVKRIGLVERAGRGVDTIFLGVLRYGRTAPDYSKTTLSDVVLSISTDKADLTFLKFIAAAEYKQGKKIHIVDMIALSTIREQRRITARQLASTLHGDLSKARQALERLLERGLVEAQGRTHGRSYMLSAATYKATGDTVGYVRQAGFSDIQHEQMILSLVEQQGQIRRSHVISLCGITPPQAFRLLKRMEKKGKIVSHGARRGAYYTLPE